MSIPAPPSFESLFNNQNPRRQSSSDSTYDPNPRNENGYSNQLGADRPMNDEPQSISRRDSGSSSTSHMHPGREGSGSSYYGKDRVRAVRGQDRQPSKQESVVFDPISSSTLISTAAESRNNIGDIMFGRQQGNGQGHSHQLPMQQQQQNLYTPNSPNAYPSYTPQQYDSDQWNGEYSSMPMYNAQPSPFDMSGASVQAENGPSGQETYLMEQHSPYPSNYDAGQQNGTWGNEFIGQDSGTGNEQYGWNGGEEMGVDDTLVELERIISNSNPGSHVPSRTSTPFQLDNNMRQSFTGSLPEPAFDQTIDSIITSRSTSPYPAAANNISTPVSGTFRRNSPSPHPPSPYFNKAQSPPALIIPNQQHSPSPVLPPIITSTVINETNQNQQQVGAGLGGGAGGLFPPANPALEGLTGMAGISPIAPDADGPMICIQPSTPISGLKDGRGVFDFKRVTQSQHNQQQQTPQTAASRSLSRHASAERLDQLAQNQSSQNQQAFQNILAQQWAAQDWGSLRPGNPRPRARSDSHMADVELFNRQQSSNSSTSTPMANRFSIPQDLSENDLLAAIENWRMTSSLAQASNVGTTVDPRSLPGQEGLDLWNDFKMSQQFAQLQAQRNRLPSVNTNVSPSGQQGSGNISPTSLAFYASMGIDAKNMPSLGTSSAPFYQSTFQDVSMEQWPQTAGPTSKFLMPDQGGLGPRRRSFAEGMNHPAIGAGTPGYGVEFARLSPFGTLDPGRIRGSGPIGHRRAAKSEDLGRPGTGSGWGVGAGGSTADFLNSITANDGTLLPPSRGRSHSRHSSASSARSASPALSVSSQGSSFSAASPRMSMPEGVQIPHLPQSTTAPKKRVAKMKVTSVATEVASANRRTNDGVFQCPVPGCGSTFTRHFNLKGHLRSHNDERPYKCLYDGCPKATVGFARQHDCKRHMLLHEGLRPFECEGCGKKFARLDALTRHHKSEQGQECAITHPLPTNPDGSAMSESQYKAYRAAQHNAQQARINAQSQGNGQGMPFSAIPQQPIGLAPGRRTSSFGGYLSGDDRSGGEEDMGTGSGMEDYDRI